MPKYVITLIIYIKLNNGLVFINQQIACTKKLHTQK